LATGDFAKWFREGLGLADWLSRYLQRRLRRKVASQPSMQLSHRRCAAVGE